ncbi:MAG: ABC transporter substrate-binding protein [Phycisphaerales bacterium]|nr:ABC transporter substrate-binding protein [Phycisphaerales bacterium]
MFTLSGVRSSKLTLAALLVSGLAAFSGCGEKKDAGAPAGGNTGGSAANTPAPETPAPEGASFKLGHYASLTGSEATFGVSTDNGIKLAVEEQNAAGGVKGKKVELITYDNQGKPQESVTAVTRLIQQDKVLAVLGEVASSRSLAGGPVCQRLGVPMISPSSTNPDVTAVGDMISRVCFIDPFQGYVGAKFVAENLKKIKGATLYNRAQAYSSGLNTNFKEAFAKLGGSVISEQAYSDGDNDFSAQLSAIKAAGAEFIYVPGYYTEVVNIAKQARKLGLNLPLVGGDGWDSEELKNAGDALNGCYFSNHYSHEDPRPEVQEFVKKYQAKYGKVPDGLAALGYDAAKILFDAAARAPSMSGKDLAAAINATKDYQAITGKITIDANRNAQKDAVVLEVVNGVPKYAATIPAPKN